MGATHTILTPTIIAKEALMLLKNNLVMGNLVHRSYEQEFNKIGGSVTIRKPVKFSVTTGRTRVTSTLTEQSITLNVATQKHVSWSFSSIDLTLSIEQYSERYIKPAAAALANSIDADLCALYDDVWNSVSESTGFVDPHSFIVLGKAGQKMDEEAAPQEGRCIVLNPAAHWSMANALRTLYVTDVAKPAIVKGYLAKIANFDVYMDQNIKTHTTGYYHDTGSAPLLLVGTTGGNTGTLVEVIHVRVDASSGNPALLVGDVFTIADVYAVNPMSGQSTGQLRQFVVTVDGTATDTSTSVVVVANVQPELIDTGNYKTVTTLPTADAAITVLGNETEPYPQNLAFHKNAFALVMVPLVKPEGSAFASVATENGFSIRVIRAYDINLDDDVIRLDVLYGVKTLYPELACRIFGAEG